jgi:hypothetical protein
MPRQLKIRAAGTDAGAMSETALTPPNEMTPPAAPENTFLDGDAPRLGSTPLTAPAPMGGGATPAATGSVAAPSLPVGSPVLSGPSSPMHTSADLATAAAPATPPAPVAEAAPATPSIPAPSLPSLPTAAPAVPAAPAQVTDAADTDTAQAPSQGDAEHPMAHLMGGTSRASEASQRAAELRAAKKAKAKKVKIFVAIGALVVSAVVGPPLWSWFTNALNEAGTTSTEEPAN